MSRRNEDAIEEWKASDVIIIVTHGQIIGGEPPVVPKKNMLVLQTGEIGYAVFDNVALGLTECFSPKYRNYFYESIFGGVPMSNIRENVRDHVRTLSVAVQGEETLPKQYSYTLPKDAPLGVGVFKSDGMGRRSHYYLDNLAAKFQRPGGINTAELLDFLSAKLEPERNYTILIISCSVVGAPEITNTTQSLGQRVGAQSSYVRVRSTSTGRARPPSAAGGAPAAGAIGAAGGAAGAGTGTLRQRPAGAKPGASSRIVAGNGWEEGFAPSAFEENAPETKPFQERIPIKYKVVKSQKKGERGYKVPGQHYQLWIFRDGGEQEAYNFNASVVQFDTSIDMYQFITKHWDRLQSDTEQFTEDGYPGTIMVERLIKKSWMYNEIHDFKTLDEFKKEIEKTWAPVCSKISCGFLKYGGKRRRTQRRRRAHGRRLNAKTHRNK